LPYCYDAAVTVIIVTVFALVCDVTVCRRQTALHKAACHGHLKTCQLLIVAGATLDVTDSEVITL